MGIYLTPLWSGTKSTLKVMRDFTLGTQSTPFGEALKTTVRGTKDVVTGKYVGGKGFSGIGASIKDAYNATKPAGSFWQSTKKVFTSWGPELATDCKAAKGFFGKMGAPFKSLGKRMPLIGNLLVVAMEVPNIYRAFKEDGAWAGIKETGKAAVKVGGFALGAAVGSVFGPVGSIVGGMVGGWLAEKIVGKSHTEAKAEKQQEKVKVAQELLQNPEELQKIMQQMQGIDPAAMAQTQPQAEIQSQGQVMQQAQTAAHPWAIQNNTTQTAQTATTGGYQSQAAQSVFNQSPMNAQQIAMSNNPYSKNPFGETSFMDKDFMAASCGLA